MPPPRPSPTKGGGGRERGVSQPRQEAGGGKPWSLSAHKTFRACQRRYFFAHVMASHNAADPDRREAHRLRQLSSFGDWRGRLVHHGIERFLLPALEAGSLPPCDEIVRRVLALGEEQFRFSAEGHHIEGGSSKVAAGDRFLVLRAHAEGRPVACSQVETVFAEVRRCLANLYALADLLRDLREARWRRAEARLRFDVDGVAAVAVPDLLMVEADGRFGILDWKTGGGPPDAHAVQLRLYALAVLRRRHRLRPGDLRPGDLRLREVRLLSGEILGHAVDDAALAETAELVRRSAAEMCAVAGEHRYRPEDLPRYAATPDPAVCRGCDFRRLCLRLALVPPAALAAQAGAQA